MQSTLEEVELSAVNGTHVFGPEHSKALEGLRAAQIELAHAWARSEADETIETTDRESKGLSGGKGMLGSEGKSVLDTMGSTVPSVSGRPGSSGAAVPATERRGSKLEEETEQDILLARNRREANDKYFQRVNEGVLDVVTKLEEVANAMKAVEQESRDIWGETDSARTSIHE
jgi:septum formation topological specificity factor MinE